MAKTLISRLDAENIVRAAVDPETHEATGDVYDSVNDISYPFGGGGGSDIHTLTATITNSTGDDMYEPMNWPPFADGALYPTDTIPDGGTVTSKYLYLNPVEDTYLVMISFTSYSISTYSDNVNCEVDGYNILITDPDADASIKITLVNGGGGA